MAWCLKICKENGFVGYPSWDEGKILVPVQEFNGNDQLVLDPTLEIYLEQ